MESEEIEGLSWEGYVFAEWVRRRGDLLRRCGIMSDAGEITESERKFVGLMRDAFEKNFAGQKFTVRTLDACFQHLQRVGLLPSPPKPEPPKPKPETLYQIRVRPTGGETKVLPGRFTGKEVLVKAKSLLHGGSGTPFEIIREDGQPVDMDLQPLFDNPLAQPRPQVQPRQSQQAQAAAGTEAEYLRFYQTSRTDAIKSRMRTDAEFRAWVNRSGQLEFVQASSGGVDREGHGVEPRRL